MTRMPRAAKRARLSSSVGAVGEVGQVLGQLTVEIRVGDGERAGGEDTDGFVADLPAVAVRAVHHAVPPVFGEPGHVRQNVGEAGGHEDAAGGDAAAVGEGDGEPQIPVS